jgi:IS30 family transposase
MTLVEGMDIFKLLYVERLKPSTIAAALNRKPSSITRELQKGMDHGMYNPMLAEARHREARRNQPPRLKMTDEVWNTVKPHLEKRWSPEAVAQWLKKEYPDYVAKPGLSRWICLKAWMPGPYVRRLRGGSKNVKGL